MSHTATAAPVNIADAYRAGQDIPELTYTIREPRTVRQGRETASAFEEFVLASGTFPVKLTNVDGTPWNADRDARPDCGMNVNPGPYYAVVEVPAMRVRDYYPSTAFGRTISVTDDRELVETTYSIRVYAYEVTPGEKGFGSADVPVAHADYPDKMWALDGETPHEVTVVGVHRTMQTASYRPTGFDIRWADGRTSYTTHVWSTADEAALVAGELAEALDL